MVLVGKALTWQRGDKACFWASPLTSRAGLGRSLCLEMPQHLRLTTTLHQYPISININKYFLWVSISNQYSSTSYQYFNLFHSLSTACSKFQRVCFRRKPCKLYSKQRGRLSEGGCIDMLWYPRSDSKLQQLKSCHSQTCGINKQFFLFRVKKKGRDPTHVQQW